MARWVESVVRARVLIAGLGETASPLWWRSQATTEAGTRMLALLFPRTALAASLETASRAACLEHDRWIARNGHYHLFRLPVVAETVIREWLQQPAGGDALRSLATLTAEERLAALSDLAGGAPAPEARGPLSCGPVEALRRGGTIQRMCAAYLAGFRAGRPVYPYLEEMAV